MKELLFNLQFFAAPDEEPKADDVAGSEDLVQALAKLKENSVSKEDYAKLKEEHQQLLRKVVEGEVDLSNEEHNPVIDYTKEIKDLRNELYSGENEFTNLEYVKKTLELRDAIIATGGEDPFLPLGRGVTITEADREAADRVAEVFRDAIDYAEGDSALFTAEIQRRTRDLPNTGSRKRY